MDTIKRFLIILAILFCPSLSQAATHTASSVAHADVLTAYNACSPGDTLAIPAGNAVWSSILTISKELIVQGSGVTTTRIDNTNETDIMKIDLNSDVPVRITGIHFKYSTNNYGANAITIVGKKNNSFAYTKIRIDHNKFEKGSRTVYASGWIEGLIDNNEFLNCNIAVGITGDNNYAWGRTIAVGTANALFIEDNTFTIDNNADREPSEQIYHQEGGRTVIRYNTFDGSTYTNANCLFYDTHGNQNWYDGSGDFRGQPILEVYNNTFAAHTSYRLFNLRSGSNIWHDNTITLSSGTPDIDLQDEETWQISRFNPVDIIWPVEDQITNSFFWDNTCDGSGCSVTVGASSYPAIQPARDYWMAAPASSGGSTFYNDRQGASGRGADGTLCHNAVGANAYYPYTAYQYPHPLQGSSCATTGTATVGIVESDIVAGSKTIIYTLTGDTWVATVGDNNPITDDQIAAITSNRSEAGGWNNQVLSTLAHGDVTRTSDTVLTIILPAVAGYDISQTEEDISSSVLGTSLASGVILTPTPSDFSIGVEASGSAGIGVGMVWSAQGRECVSGDGVELVR